MFIVPMFAMNAATTCRNALPRSFLSNCDSAWTGVVPPGFVFTICCFGLPLLPINETFCWFLLLCFGICKDKRNWLWNSCKLAHTWNILGLKIEVSAVTFSNPMKFTWQNALTDHQLLSVARDKFMRFHDFQA